MKHMKLITLINIGTEVQNCKICPTIIKTNISVYNEQ